MKKAKFLFAIILPVLILGAVLFFQNELLGLYLKFSLELPQIEKELTESLTEKIETKILTPPPLRSQEEFPQSVLTTDGVITWTNVQRNRQGLLLLKESAFLDAMAQAKMEDMISRQYFAHQSPSGLGVEDLAKNFGYQFIIIGENLAMGSFQDDQALVQAWIDSPGHRENILNEHYQEIGVAVGKGIFEGESTWLAVQHFGLPLSACPQPSIALQEKIEANQTEINSLRIAISELERELKSIRRRGRTLYNQKVEEYNNLVSQYNTLVDETKTLINQYNSQVVLFNDCASGVR